MSTKSTVDHPSHYHAESGIEVIAAIRAWKLGFSLGNAVKYIARAGHKDDAADDLRKARWYIDEELAHLERTGASASPARPSYPDPCRWCLGLSWVVGFEAPGLCSDCGEQLADLSFAAEQILDELADATLEELASRLAGDLGLDASVVGGAVEVRADDLVVGIWRDLDADDGRWGWTCIGPFGAPATRSLEGLLSELAMEASRP